MGKSAKHKQEKRRNHQETTKQVENNEFSPHSYSEKVYIILTLLLGFVPVLWFKGQLVAGEEFYAVDYGRWGQIFSHTWFNRGNFGQPSQLLAFKLQEWFFDLFKFLHVSNAYSLMFWHVLLSMAGALGAYLLCREFLGPKELGKNKFNPFVGFIVAVFYTFNPFFLNISPLLVPPRMVVAILPFILWLLLKYQHKYEFKWIWFLTLVLFVATPVFVNLPAGVIFFAPIGLYFLYSFITKPKLFPKLSLHLIAFFLLWFLTNVWWMYPTLRLIMAHMGSIQFSSSTFLATNASPISDVISQFGSWAFREKAGNYYYFDYNTAYYTLPLVFLKYFSFGLILYFAHRLLKIRGHDRIYNGIFFLLLFILGIFLSKGTSGVFGSFFEFLFKHFPGFWVFREPYLKFLPLAAVASVPLIAAGITEVLHSEHSLMKKKITLYAVFVGFIFVGYPFLTGGMIWKINDASFRSYIISPPPVWEKFAREWKPSDSTYLLFPSQGFTEKYNWLSGYAGNKFLMFTNAKFLNNRSAYTMDYNIYNISTHLYSMFSHDPVRFVDYARRYNIGGVLFQKDLIDPFISLQANIKTKYDKYLKTTDDITDVYEFNNGASLINLVDKNSIVSINNDTFNQYWRIKRVFLEDPLLLIDDTQQLPDFKSVLSGGYSEKDSKSIIEYDISAYKNKDYLIKFDPTIDWIVNAVLVDDKLLPDAPEIVANGLDVKSLGDNATRLKLIYTRYKKLQVIAQPVVVGKTEMNGTFVPIDNINSPEITSVRYTFKPETYNGGEGYKALLTGTIPEIRGVKSTFIAYEIDNDLNISRLLLMGELQPFKDQLPFDIKPGIDTDYSPNKHYEMVFQLDFDSNKLFREAVSSIKINNFELVHDYNFPRINMVASKIPNIKFVSEPLSKENYKEINPAVNLVDLSQVQKSGKYLQFVQSYANDWELVPISKDMYTKPNLITLFTAYLNSSTHITASNLEYFSNGWNLDTLNNIDTSYVMLVYRPEVYYALLNALAYFVIVSVSIGIALYELKFKKRSTN